MNVPIRAIRLDFSNIISDSITIIAKVPDCSYLFPFLLNIWNVFYGRRYFQHFATFNIHQYLQAKCLIFRLLQYKCCIATKYSILYTCENGLDAICSISTNNLWRRRNISYFCLIFHNIAAISNNNRKHLKLWMKQGNYCERSPSSQFYSIHDTVDCLWKTTSSRN